MQLNQANNIHREKVYWIPPVLSYINEEAKQRFLVERLFSWIVWTSWATWHLKNELKIISIISLFSTHAIYRQVNEPTPQQPENVVDVY